MESPWLLIALLTFLTIGGNIVALIGCITPTVKDISLYRVNVTLVANGLHTLAGFDSPNKTEVPLSSALPTYWYWGMSGICDVYETTGETLCRRRFPPTEDLLSIVEDSLRDHFGTDQQDLINSTVASWNATLSHLDPSRLAAKQGVFAAESKASAALAILAIAVDAFTILIALCAMRRGSSHRSLAAVPFLSGLITGAAAVLAFLSMRNGVHGAVSTGENAGPAIIVLFVAAALRILSAAAAGYGSSSEYYGGPPHSYDFRDNYTAPSWGTPRYRPYSHDFGNDYTTPSWDTPLQKPHQPAFESRNEEIGFLGENHIFEWLKRRQLPGWSWRNWTSGLRRHAGIERFTENESYYADFTYEDRGLEMKRLLADQGVPVSPFWSPITRYHLEVKSTPGGLGSPFFVSAYQLRLMSKYANTSSDAYVLVRVFDVEGVPTARFFLNPHQHSALQWGPLQEDGKYAVTVRY